MHIIVTVLLKVNAFVNMTNIYLGLNEVIIVLLSLDINYLSSPFLLLKKFFL